MTVVAAPPMLRISDKYEMPVAAAVARFVILGKSGAGKTNADTVIAEELIRAGIPTFILDPLGNMYGLRSSADGESAGLPVVIFGGRHGDVELGNPTAMAKMLLEQRLPAVIDLSEEEYAYQRGFAEDFCTAILRYATDVAHLILEEADRFAPNTIGKNGVKTFARVARNSGIGWTFSTQRAQLIAPEVIESSSAIVAMKMTGDLAQQAIGKETVTRVGGKRLANEIILSLAKFTRGDAWFIPDPDWLGDAGEDDAEPVRFRFRLRETFDSAKPPSFNDLQRREPRVLAEIDIAALRDALAMPAPESEDVDELNDRIAELQRQVADLKGELALVSAKTVTVERPIFADEDRAQWHNRLMAIGGLWERIRDEAVEILPQIEDCVRRIDAFDDRGVRKTHAEPASNGVAAPAKVWTSPDRARADAPPPTGLSKYEASLLRALARRLPARWTPRSFLGALSGRSIKSSAFDGAVRSLLSSASIETDGSRYAITQRGLQLIGERAPSTPMTIDQAIEVWTSALGRQAGAMLLHLQGRGWMTREQLSAAAGYSSTSSSFDGALRELRENGLIEIDAQRRVLSIVETTL